MGSIPAAALCTIGVVATYVPSKDVPRFRLPDGAFYFGSLAQMVERSLCMREVMGSMPMSSTVYSFNLILPTFHKRNDKNVYTFIFGRISLVAEHRTCNAEVVSSILTFGFIFLESCLVAFILIRFQAILLFKSYSIFRVPST